MNYGDILKKAWQIIWKNKILWLFGVLAGCTASGSGGGGGSGGSGSSNFTMQLDSFEFLSPSTQQAVDGFYQFITSIPIWVWVVLVLGLIVIGFVLSVLFFLAGTLGQVGVITGTGMADEAEVDAAPLSLSAIFTGLKPHYWKVLLLQFGFRVAGFFLTLFLIVPIILLAICTCCFGLFFLIPIGWFIDILLNFTTIAIIEEGLGIFEAIGRAWRVVTRNLGRVLVMFLILGIGGLIIGLMISFPLLIIPVPLVANLVLSGARSITVGLIISLLLFLVFLPVLIFLGGVLRAYILSAWTLTFRRLRDREAFEPVVLNGETEEIL